MYFAKHELKIPTQEKNNHRYKYARRIRISRVTHTRAHDAAAAAIRIFPKTTAPPSYALAL